MRVGCDNKCGEKKNTSIILDPQYLEYRQTYQAIMEIRVTVEKMISARCIPSGT